MFEATREYLKKIGMPQGDAFEMPSSDKDDLPVLRGIEVEKLYNEGKDWLSGSEKPGKIS